MKEYILELKKLIPQKYCEKIISYYDKDYESGAVIKDNGKSVVDDKNIRNCVRKNLLKPKSFGETLVTNFVKSRITTAYDIYKTQHSFLSLKGINQAELLRYDANQYDSGFTYHVDATANANRTLSISICLNNDFIGGEFTFNLNGEEIQFGQNVGDAILFPSNFMFPHQVKKVIDGTRFAIVGWLA